MHKTTMAVFLTGALSLAGAGGLLAAENEAGHQHEPVTMSELPAAAQKTLKHEAKGGKIEELRKETRKDGSVVYEAEVVKNGKGTNLEVGADGKILERGKTHDESSEHGEK
jgi:uncharacterized membrane protein YkoI